MLQNTVIQIPTKKKTKTIICPVLLYESKTWGLSKKVEKRFFFNKIPQKIYGPRCEQGEWRRKPNREIRDIYNSMDKYVK